MSLRRTVHESRAASFCFAAGALAFLVALPFGVCRAGDDVSFPLKVLREHYEEERVKARQPVEELATKYRVALVELQSDVQAAAKLDELVAVREEIVRFDRSKAPPGKVSKFPSLAALQRIYAGQQPKALEAGARRLVAAKRAHRQMLAAEMQRLTVDGKVDEALVFKQAIADLGDVNAAAASWTRDMVLHLRFDSAIDGVVTDASGSVNHGKLRGDAKLELSKRKRGKFLRLDGSGDYVECAHDASLSLSTDATISLWVRPHELHNLRGLVCKYIPNNAYTLRTAKGRRGTRVIFGDYNNANSSDSKLQVGKWVHITVTLADHKVRFYFNGRPDSEGFRPKRVPLAQNRNPVRIGSDYDGRYLKADIDDVRMFRRALSAAEVAELFRADS